MKRLIEPPHTAKPARKCNLDHRKIGLMKKLLGK